MGRKEHDEPTVYQFNPFRNGFSTIFFIDPAKLEIRSGRIGRILTFFVIWGIIGFGQVGVGYVLLHYLLPEISEPLYQTTLTILSPYYSGFVSFATSNLFYPAAISTLSGLYLLTYNKPNRTNFDGNEITYRIKDEPLKISAYLATIAFSHYLHTTNQYTTITLYIFLSITAVFIFTRLRRIDRADKYDMRNKTAFYPRRIPVAVISSITLFGILTTVTGDIQLGVDSMKLAIISLFILISFRVIYPDSADIRPELFYGYHTTEVTEQIELENKTKHNAHFIPSGNPLAALKTSIQQSSSKKQSNTDQDVVGTVDRAPNRGATPTTAQTDDETPQTLTEENVDVPTEPDNTPKYIIGKDVDTQQDSQDDAKDQIINSQPPQADNSDDKRVYTPQPTVTPDDFDQPVLHYTTEIDSELVVDIDENPLINAVTLLDEYEDCVTTEAKKETARELRRKTRRDWWPVEHLTIIRDAIAEKPSKYGDSIFDDDCFAIFNEYAKQLTRAERYLKRKQEQEETQNKK